MLQPGFSWQQRAKGRDTRAKRSGVRAKAWERPELTSVRNDAFAS